MKVTLILWATMPRRQIKPVPTEQLSSWSTQRLFAYRDHLLSLEDHAESSDLNEREIAALDQSFLHFKDDPRWKPLYKAVLAELSRREHVA